MLGDPARTALVTEASKLSSKPTGSPISTLLRSFSLFLFLFLCLSSRRLASAKKGPRGVNYARATVNYDSAREISSGDRTNSFRNRT